MSISDLDTWRHLFCPGTSPASSALQRPEVVVGESVASSRPRSRRRRRRLTSEKVCHGRRGRHLESLFLASLLCHGRGTVDTAANARETTDIRRAAAAALSTCRVAVDIHA